MNCIIIEDEETGRAQLRNFIEEIDGLTLLGEAADCASGLTLISAHPETDLIFLDIELTDGTGFDLIEQITDPPKIIFITNYEAYALRAFEINALDYIQKPLTRARLESALERLNTGPASPMKTPVKLRTTDLILLTNNNQKYFTRVADILAIESDENYTHVIRADGKQFVLKKTLAAWEAEFPFEMFRRAGRSHLINMTLIDRMETKGSGGQLWFKNSNVPIALTHAAMKKLQQLVRNA
ncbi:MAG: LytR/AlgR family response regulator transcription factor [Kiritimatiellales bacterium]